MVLGAVYMLNMVKRVFFGRIVRDSNRSLVDLNSREVTVLMPLVFMIFLMGLMPDPFFDKMAPAVKNLLGANAAPAVADVTPKTENHKAVAARAEGGVTHPVVPAKLANAEQGTK